MNPAPEYRESGKIVLGSPSLTAGLPGTGPLSLAELQTWLDDPRNHEPLDFLLPVALRSAADQVQIPADNPLTRARIELGRQLFFDKRLARNRVFSCSDCHAPREAYARRMVMPQIERNPLPVINRILSTAQFWDGHAPSLEAQPLTPITRPYEMNTSPEECVARLNAIPGYRLQFTRIFGEVNFANVGKALACFERALVTGSSPIDDQESIDSLQRENFATLDAVAKTRLATAQTALRQHPLSAAAQRGRTLFASERTGCRGCHSGPNYTDEAYYAVGLAPLREPHDEGRFRLTEQPADRNAFKTPTLRNLPKSAPYMHDGRYETLLQVVQHFNRGGDPAARNSPLVRPLGLTWQEELDLVAFLEALDGPLPPVAVDRLPE